MRRWIMYNQRSLFKASYFNFIEFYDRTWDYWWKINLPRNINSKINQICFYHHLCIDISFSNTSIKLPFLLLNFPIQNIIAWKWFLISIIKYQMVAKSLVESIMRCIENDFYVPLLFIWRYYWWEYFDLDSWRVIWCHTFDV